MISRSVWDDARVESSFRITGDNFVDSPNRNESNGTLLLTRYRDENNFYYAGLRVDGHAVIKKKYEGTYRTLAEEQIVPGDYKNGQKKNLLPHNEWITLRLDTTTQNGITSLTLFIKEDEAWKKVLSATDGLTDDSPSITSGFVGLRTDFMDVEFDDFRVETI